MDDNLTAAALGSWGMFPQDIWDDPFGLYAAVRADGAVHPITLYDGRPAWLVAGFDAVRRAFTDPRLSRDVAAYRDRWPERPPMYPSVLCKRHMLNADPPDHGRLRGPLNRAFTPRRVEALRPRIQEITDKLLADLPDDGEVDLIKSFAFPLPITVICEMVGVEGVAPHELDRMVTDLLGNAHIIGAEEAAQAASERLDAYLAELIETKRRRPGNDLISELITTSDEDGNRLSTTELAASVFLLVIAGHETTVNLIANGVVALLDEPSQLERLLADPALVPRAVTELLRFDGSLHQAAMRVATEDLDLDGVPVPEGGLVVLSLAAANRDPAHFTDPDRLDVTRPEVNHLGFGHGAHFCLGAPLALLEAEVALGSLLRRHPELSLAVPRSDIHWRPAMNLRGIPSLPVRLG